MSELSPVLRLPSLISDGMVLPAHRRINLWGWGPPRGLVTVQFAGWTAISVCSQDGTWNIELTPQPPSAKSLTLTVSCGDQQIIVRDILIGMVLLVGGQSNMAFAAAGDADFVTMQADPGCRRLRFFTVLKDRSEQDRHDCVGHWQSGDGVELGTCSAVAAWAALTVIRATDMPVGIIAAAWGGTAIACWLDDETHASTSENRAETPADWQPNVAAYGAEVLAYETSSDGRLRDPCWYEPDTGLLREADGESGWKLCADPFTIPSTGPRTSDVVWYRSSCSLSADDVGRKWTIDLGLIDAEWIMWIDGEEVARLDRRTPSFWLHGCRVVVTAPRRDMRIVVRCCYRLTAGSRYGRIENTGLVSEDGRRYALGAWEERAESVPAAPVQHASRPWFAGQVPWGLGQPVTAFHAMIAPLCRYAIDGVMWYQGESDVQSHAYYASRLQGLIRLWRRRWAEPGLPMVVVQLAGYHQPSAEPSNELIPELRHVQQAVAFQEPGVGLISAIDCGDADDIHPKRKRVLGERLGTWALANIRSSAVPWRHPQIVSVERRHGIIRLTVACAIGPLTVHPETERGRIFDVAQNGGAPAWSGFTIDGHVLEVPLPDAVGPVRIRCCWQDHPHGFVRDGRGMPLLPCSVTA